MKKKIEQILNGKFKYDQPELLFSKEKLEIKIKAVFLLVKTDAIFSLDGGAVSWNGEQ